MNPQNTKLQKLLEIESQTFTPYRVARAVIERTKTNKELQKIETEYRVRLKAIFTKIVLEYKNKEYLLHEARQKYGASISLLIKSMVTRVYFLGMEYVGRAFHKPYLITFEKSDEQKILEQTEKAEDMFWRLITKYLQVIKNRSLVKPRLEQLKEISQIKVAAVGDNKKKPKKKPEEDNLLLSIFTNVGLVLSAIATAVLGISTVEQARQLEKAQYLSLDGRSLTEEGLQNQNTNKKYIFATSQDEKVCDICGPLEGEEWDIDDPDIISIPEDTHPNCRCRLLLQIDDEIMSM